MRRVIWKNHVSLCPSVLLMASARFHRPEENIQSEPSWSLPSSFRLWEPAVNYSANSRSNGQTRQRWSNMNQYSVTVMPISLLKCLQKHLVVYCLAVKLESLWPGSHVEISWGKTKHRLPAGAQPIGTLSLSLWNDLWLAKVSRHGLDFLKPVNRAMRRSRSLVFSQNTKITICWKVIMEFFPNDAQIYCLPPTLSHVHTTRLSKSSDRCTVHTTQLWCLVIGSLEIVVVFTLHDRPATLLPDLLPPNEVFKLCFDTKTHSRNTW